MTNFAQWLNITLSNQNLRGRTLARKLGVHDSVVSRWRNGQCTPNLDTVMELARVLGVNPLQLAVTAGLMDPDTVHVQPLEIPVDEAHHAFVRDQIRSIKGLNSEQIDELLQHYNQRIANAK